MSMTGEIWWLNVKMIHLLNQNQIVATSLGDYTSLLGWPPGWTSELVEMLMSGHTQQLGINHVCVIVIVSHMNDACFSTQLIHIWEKAWDENYVWIWLTFFWWQQYQSQYITENNVILCVIRPYDLTILVIGWVRARTEIRPLRQN